MDLAARITLIAAALILCGWLYWLTVRVQWLLDRLEQLLPKNPPKGRHHADQ